MHGERRHYPGQDPPADRVGSRDKDERFEVRLQNHAAQGITDKDFELAARIEDLVQWQPGAEGGALEGTPQDDPRFSYVKYD